MQNDGSDYNDIDLVEDQGFKNPYYFCMRLLNLTRNKKKLKAKKDNEIIDQTLIIEDSFWIMKTQSISLNKESLHFIVPDPNNTNTDFEMKMYRTSENSVEELTSLEVNSLTYIELFLEEGKKIFNEILALSPEYSLEYQIYIEKSKIELDNLLLSNQNESINYAFKKKQLEFIEVDNEKSEILRKDILSPESQILRKSLQFNTKKLKKIKDKKLQKSFEKSKSINKSKNSFLDKISDMIKQGFTPKKELEKEEYPENEDDDKSISLTPPLIGPHKYNRPQNKFYYHRISIEREKELERVKKEECSKIQANFIQENNWAGSAVTRKVKLFLLLTLIIIVIYLMANTFKKNKPSKWLKSISTLKF